MISMKLSINEVDTYMDEFKFIETIKPNYYQQSSVIKGIGDDGAIVQPPSGTQLIIATDTMVEHVHFSFDYMSLEDVGYRVLAANISDLAAMGSFPLYYIVNISSPKSFANSSLVKLINGMKELAGLYQMDLIGGDTTSSEQLVITVTVFGAVLPNKSRLRNLAQAGDVVFVTGNLGEVGYGLHLIHHQKFDPENYFIKKHIRPVPRMDFVEKTKDIKRICLNDVSDGISSELNEIAESSNVLIEIDWSSIPIHEDMQSVEKDLLKRFALSSGEDFELVGTCSPNDWKIINKTCVSQNLKVTKIGDVFPSKNNQSEVYIKDGMQKIKLGREGYQHGKNR